MVIGIAIKIIKKEVSNNLFNNINDKKDPKVMWKKFKVVCSQVEPGVIYSILQKLFIYPKINKPKEFEKPMTNIFAKVRFLVK